MFIPFMIFTLTVEIYGFFTSFTFLQIVLNFQETLIFNTITYSLLLLIDVVFPLLMTILRIIKFTFKKRKDPMEKGLRDPRILEMFKDHCAKEFAGENLFCYLDILAYEKEPTMQVALEMFNKYLNGITSLYEVAVDQKENEQVFEKIQKGEFTPDLFDPVKAVVFKNMDLNWKQFIVGEAYWNYVGPMKERAEMITGVAQVETKLEGAAIEIKEEIYKNVESFRKSINPNGKKLDEIAREVGTEVVRQAKSFRKIVAKTEPNEQEMVHVKTETEDVAQKIEEVPYVEEQK